MHCACANRPYFHFRSKIWRHHRVPRPRFPLRRENFGDSHSHTFKADIELIFAWVFRTFWPKWGFCGVNRGRVVRYWPPTNSFILLGVLTSVPILVKIDQEMRPWETESARRRTDTQTDTLTDRQTQTDFIICSMLYAIAMRQIINALCQYTNSYCIHCGWHKQAPVSKI